MEVGGGVGRNIYSQRLHVLWYADFYDKILEVICEDLANILSVQMRNQGFNLPRLEYFC